MSYTRIAILTVAVILHAGALHAQATGEKPVSGEFKQLSVARFITELETKTGCRFYYDTSHIAGVQVDLAVSAQPLARVLALAFDHTELLYAIDRQGNVFITKGVMVKTELPSGDLRAADTGMAKPLTRGAPAGLTRNENDGKAATQEFRQYEVGDKNMVDGKRKAVVSGYARDALTGEPVGGAYLSIDAARVNVLTDEYGHFSFPVLPGRHLLAIQSMGMKSTRRQLVVYGDGRLDIDLHTEVQTLKAVVVSAQKTGNVTGTQMGVQKIDIRAIRQVPVVLGEADVLKVILTLPGVKTVGESSTGFNVRGGSADQNLILFNDATIYNPSHFFGLFSAFNPEVVKDAELFKSSIPARYGGRLSSVLNINSRDGNKKDLSGVAGIGMLTSRLELEGPLIKDRSSFMLGGRTTYASWLLNLLPAQYKKSKASFYDLNLHINHEINKRNSIYLTAYMSRDHFNLNSDTVYGYGNRNISLKWKYQVNSRLNALFTTGYDGYRYSISSEYNPVNAYRMQFAIHQGYLKAHFNYNPSPANAIDFGLSSLYYSLYPGSYGPVGKASVVAPQTITPEQALESAAYLSDRYTVSPRVTLDAGIRYSLFNYLGPKAVNRYAAGLPLTEANRLDAVYYPRRKVIQTYAGPEWRVSLRYLLSDSTSLKAGFNTQRQYIHMMSNATAMAPTDIWKLSDGNIRPQYGSQFSLGWYRNFRANTIETSVEVYYKLIRDYLDYKSGAVLVMNPHLETEVMRTRGKAYGAELFIRKTAGKLNGWVSYTYSRIVLQADDPLAGESINGGRYYPSNYDKPHDVTLIGNYRLTHRFSFSLNTTYSTGRPVTLPAARFNYGGSVRTFYTDRNANRIPDYFRADVAVNIDGNHRLKQKMHNSWTCGVYNLTGRKNPYSVYFISENGGVKGYKLSIFGSAIPYINFNCRF